MSDSGQSTAARDTVFVAGPHHMETASGRYVDLLRPDPATIVLYDVAHHLAQANRYAGACRRPMSVAEHALLVADRLRSQGSGARTVLLGLHHDDPEAYAQDITRPLKLALARNYEGDSNYAQIEKGLHSAIHVALGLPDWTDGRRAAVRAADDWALAAEAWHLLPSHGEGWFCWGLYDPRDERNPPRAASLQWGEHDWAVVRDEWLTEHHAWAGKAR